MNGLAWLGRAAARAMACGDRRSQTLVLEREIGIGKALIDSPQGREGETRQGRCQQRAGIGRLAGNPIGQETPAISGGRGAATRKGEAIVRGGRLSAC